MYRMPPFLEGLGWKFAMTLLYCLCNEIIAYSCRINVCFTLGEAMEMMQLVSSESIKMEYGSYDPSDKGLLEIYSSICAKLEFEFKRHGFTVETVIMEEPIQDSQGVTSNKMLRRSHFKAVQVKACAVFLFDKIKIMA